MTGKPTYSMTLGEAEAYRMGYDVGYAAGMKAAAMAKEAVRCVAVAGKPPECAAQNPDVMCKQCNCWKMFRGYCS